MTLALAVPACEPPPISEEDEPALHCTEAMVHGTRTQYATNFFALPNQDNKAAADYDGDGRTENQLNKLNSIFSVTDLKPQPFIEMGIAAGQGITLLELTAPNLQKSDCASLTLSHAKPPQPGLPLPQFHGEDFFPSDPSSQVTLYGVIKDGVFHSVPSRWQPAPDKRFELTLRVGDEVTLQLPLRAVSVTATAQQTINGPALTDGSFNGVLTQQDMLDKVPKMMATLLTTRINAAKSQMEADPLINALELDTNEISVKKCQVTADCCRLSYKTCKLLPEEFIQSPLGGLLVPDVRVFADDGDWLPLPGSRDRNGYSAGLRFNAVNAAF